MSLDRAVLSLAGTIVLLIVLLGALVSSCWLRLTAFVGLNLLQSSITGIRALLDPVLSGSRRTGLGTDRRRVDVLRVG